MFRSLKVLSFVLVAVGIVFAAEIGQAVAESFLADAETQMTALVNQHRTGIGVGKLESNEALRMVARRQTQRMVAAGYISHNPDLAREAGEAVPDWLLLGENVGVGPSVEMVEQAFLDSPRHRQNIETARFDTIGLGAMASQDGSLYFTQNFADLAGPKPAKAVAPKPAAAPVVRAQPPAVAVPPPAPVPVAAAPTAAPDAAPVAAVPEVLAATPEAEKSRAGLLQSLVAMVAHALSKLAFWN